MLTPFTDSPTSPGERREPAVAPSHREDADAIADWLLRQGPRLEVGMLLGEFAGRLLAAQVPVDRLTTAIETLHSEYAGVGRFWTREEGGSLRYFPHGDAADKIYRASPFYVAHQTGEWLFVDVQATPNERFGVIEELKAAGYRHYICVPITFTDGTENGLSIATRAEEGFDARTVALLRAVMPAFAAVLEMRALSRRMDNVLRIYVGDEPHRAILKGAIRRGQVSRISSAILFADMRSYTRLSASLSPEAAVELLNGMFDCLVPAIEREGGEILKYMGDGLLAIFRDRGDDTGGEAQAALAAAQEALSRVDLANDAGHFSMPVRVGIALHHGEAAYGNVGSGARLDFTVVGRDVNLASRLAGLNKVLAEPLLMSKPFVERLWGDPVPLGAHIVDGFEEPVVVFKPR